MVFTYGVLTYDFLELHSFCSVQSKYLIKMLSPLHFIINQPFSRPIKTTKSLLGLLD